MSNPLVGFDGLPLGSSLAIPTGGRASGVVRPPGSKSLTNRAILVSALASGESELLGVLDSEDTQVMIESLRRLSVEIDPDTANATVRVRGCAGRLVATDANLFLANSGTSLRFLAAIVALGRGQYRLDGVPRMRQRPIEDLLAALRSLGVDARSEHGTGCPPVVVVADGLPGGVVRLPGDVSSQFASALLLAAPYAAEDLSIEVEGDLVSAPFLEMTRRVMEDFGVELTRVDSHRTRVRGRQCYRGRRYSIEPDATAASYFFAAAALTGGEVTVDGLGSASVQGDLAFVDLLQRMGATVQRESHRTTVRGQSLVGIDADLCAVSDTMLTLAVVAALATGPTTIRGIGHTRRQETDRVHAVATELTRLGAHVEEWSDGLRIEPRPLHAAEIETYDDHRVAMSFALAGLRVPGVVVRNPACVAKTYPGYFQDLAGVLTAQ